MSNEKLIDYAYENLASLLLSLESKTKSIIEHIKELNHLGTTSIILEEKIIKEKIDLLKTVFYLNKYFETANDNIMYKNMQSCGTSKVCEELLIVSELVPDLKEEIRTLIIASLQLDNKYIKLLK